MDWNNSKAPTFSREDAPCPECSDRCVVGVEGTERFDICPTCIIVAEADYQSHVKAVQRANARQLRLAFDRDAA